MLNDSIRLVKHTLRRFVAAKPMAERVDLSGRNIIVTGAAEKSIGYEVAKTLAAWGARVTATSLYDAESLQRALHRDVREMSGAPDKGEPLVSTRQLDLCDPGSVADFVSWYGSQHDGLHVLVNNAGVFKDIAGRSKTPLVSEDGMEIHWRTNFLGTFHLVSLLLPMLAETGKHSGDARVVITSSHVYEDGSNDLFFKESTGPYSSWSAYAQSKLALVHLSFELQRRYAGKYNLQSAALHPGSVRTNLTSSGLDNNPIIKTVHRLLEPALAPFFLKLEHGAQTTISCATRTPFTGGRFYERCAISRASEQVNDKDVARRLWEQAERWVSDLPVRQERSDRRL